MAVRGRRVAGGTFRLPPLAGAVLLQALRAAAGDLDHPHGGHDGPQGGDPGHPPGGHGPGGRTGRTAAFPRKRRLRAQPVAPTSSGLADALVAVAEAFLAGKVAGADDAEVYQVVVHVGTAAITPAGPAGLAGPPAPPSPRGLPPFPWKRRRRPGRPGRPGRAG